MSSRNWFIKFNLDDMSADMDTLETDHEIAEWFKGFKRGARGEAPTNQTGPGLKGNLFGFKASQEAESYRHKQSEKGRRSVEARRKKHGSAAPLPNHGSTAVQERFKPDTEPANIQHPTSNSDQGAASIFDAPPVAPPAKPTAPHMAACDAKFTHGDLLSRLRRIGARMTKANDNLDEWQALIDKHGWDVVSDAASQVGPVDRWPSRVEQRLWDKANKCPYPDGSNEAMDWHVLHGALGNLQ